MQEKSVKMKCCHLNYFVCLLFCLTGCANNQAMQEDDKSHDNVPSVILLDYTQSGGLLGAHDHLVVQDSGEVQLIRKQTSTTYNLSSEEVNALKILLDEIYPDPPPVLKPGDPVRGGADYMTYTFTTQEHTFSYTDMDMPARLRSVIEQINKRLIQRAAE